MNTGPATHGLRSSLDRHTPGDLAARLRRLVSSEVLDLPQPGCGHTAERLRRLATVAAEDLPLARMAEAHLDAITILREAGRTPEPGCIYGVWASDTPAARLSLTPTPDGFDLAGRKGFCTGVGLVDRALVTAHRFEAGADSSTDAGSNDTVQLVDLDAVGTFTADASAWVASAFAETNTTSISIDQLAVDCDRLVGGPGWYLDRIGFWHGALAPAACWAGGAIGLADHCVRLVTGRSIDDHTAAHLGVIDSARWELGVVLDASGDAVDAEPDDVVAARLLAARTRTSVERLVTLVIDHALRAFGPRLLAHDEWAARRVSELQLYVRQHHDTRDHAALGRDVLGATTIT